MAMSSEVKNIVCTSAALLGFVARSVAVELITGRHYCDFGIADILIALACVGAVSMICDLFGKEDSDNDTDSVGSR